MHLSSRTDVESGAYAVFKISERDDCIKFLVTSVLIPNERDYLNRTSVGVSLTPKFTEKALQICELTQSHLLDLHNHPWASDVNFSGIDDREAIHTKVPYLAKYLPKTKIAFIVFGKSPMIAKARFWHKPATDLIEIERILVI